MVENGLSQVSDWSLSSTREMKVSGYLIHSLLTKSQSDCWKLNLLSNTKNGRLEFHTTHHFQNFHLTNSSNKVFYVTEGSFNITINFKCESSKNLKLHFPKIMSHKWCYNMIHVLYITGYWLYMVLYWDTYQY